MIQFSLFISARARFLYLLMIGSYSLLAQDEKELKPVTRVYAITQVNVIPAPGKRIDQATVIIKDGLITAVGKSIAIPTEAVVIKADSMFLYAGFIDGLSRAGVNKPKEEATRERVKDPGNPVPERAGIAPQNDVRNSLNAGDKGIEDLRNIGFTVAHVVPYGNLLPGQGSIVLLGGKSVDQMVLINNSSLYAELSGANGVYPTTIMAVMAKWRELYKQAVQAKSYQSLYASNRSGLERPASDRVLEAFYPIIDQRTPVLFKSEKMLDAHRILTLKSELGFSLMLADVKEGWLLATKIKASGAKVFLSLDLPEDVKKDDKKDERKSDKQVAGKSGKDDSTRAKEVAKPKTAFDIENEALEKRKAEAIANYVSQASVFNKASVPFGFSSFSAKPKDIPSNLRRMITAGLSEDAALAALTTTPAKLLGLSDRMGTVENGKMANLVITDKSYFNEKAKVRYVFVDGVMYKMELKEEKKSDPNAKVEIEGSWSTVTESPQGSNEGKVTFKKEGNNYSGTVSGGRLPSAVDMTSVGLEGNKLSYSYALNFGGNSIKVEVEVTIDGDTFKGNASVGERGSFAIEGTKVPKK